MRDFSKWDFLKCLFLRWEFGVERTEENLLLLYISHCAAIAVDLSTVAHEVCLFRDKPPFSQPFRYENFGQKDFDDLVSGQFLKKILINNEPLSSFVSCVMLMVKKETSQ